jgi:hypothetical protein
MKTFCLLFSLLLISPIFCQNVPNDIILAYQNEIELWLIQNNIYVEPEIKNYNGIELFRGPFFSKKYPAPKIFGRGGSVIDCFAFGKFLSLSDCERIYDTAYSCIPEDNGRIFEPFLSLDNFKNSLIFNPKILFDIYSNSTLNPPADKNAYLIFYFGSYSERFPDTVFSLQLAQLIEGNAKEMLIFPYGYYYALFRINGEGEINLVNFYGVN